MTVFLPPQTLARYLRLSSVEQADELGFDIMIFELFNIDNKKARLCYQLHKELQSIPGVGADRAGVCTNTAAVVKLYSPKMNLTKNPKTTWYNNWVLFVHAVIFEPELVRALRPRLSSLRKLLASDPSPQLLADQPLFNNKTILNLREQFTLWFRDDLEELEAAALQLLKQRSEGVSER